MFPYQDGDIWLPLGFVFDFESVPRWLRGPTGVNKRGGTAHDGACRKGVNGPDQACEFVCPGMTKSIAADIYFEVMEYTDSIDVERFKNENHPWIPKPAIVPVITFKDWFRRNLKSGFVRYWPGGFFQKFALDATCQEVAGIECDPYVTVAKLDALIAKTEVVSADLKKIDADTDAMVEKTDEVTAELKEVKADTIEKNLP